MSRFNTVPIIIQQMVEDLKDKRTSDSVKFYKAQALETVREYCDNALKEWQSKQTKGK